MSTNSHTDVPGKTKTLGNHDPSDPYSDLEVATKPSKKEGATSQSEGPDIAAPSDTDGEAIEPYHVHSHREFDDLILDMMPHFEGRETEQNWLLRERSVRLLRRLTKGNAPHDFPQYYLPAIKSLLDGILKAVNSLRTTLSTVGCLLVQEIARTVGNAIDPWVEILLQNMLKVCGALKKITSQNGNATVEAIVANASYSHRLMQHMWWACEDKNVQPRLYATNWLRIIINTHIPAHRGALEHGGGLDIIEKCVKKGLADPNPGVREAMRSTFWVFYKAWKERGEEIIESLDAKSRNLLEKDPGNPNGTKQPQASKSRANSHSAATSRPTLKETIAAQKRARLAAQKSAASSAASRPESEASVYSEHTKAPVHSAPPPTTASQPKPTRPGQMRAHATTSSGVPGGTLSSAPLRPGQRSKRPEQPRPMVDTNTRKNGHGDSGDTSPSGSPTRYYPQSQPRSRIGTAVTPGRPKSRLETSPDRSREHRAAPTASSVPPRPKRLDIASLKGDGRAALVAHAGNALSPKVIMSPAIDDDVFGQYENTEPPLPPLPPQPKQYPLAPAPRLRDVEMRDEQMEGEQHVDAIPAHDEREEAAQVPLSDSSFVSPEPQHQPQPQPQAIDIGSPKSVRSVGASSIAMSTRGTSTPP
ncbi:suppressor of tub2 mutation, partial [Ascosphaera atra]